jgi:polyferredoxin
MNISRQTFINLNKYMIVGAIVIYFIGVFTPVKFLQPGLLFVFGAGFFCLLHINYFCCRLKHAAHLWLFPLIMTLVWYPLALRKDPAADNMLLYIITLLLSVIPVLAFMFGRTEEQAAKKQRLPIVSFRSVVQVAFFLGWLSVTAFVYIRGADYYTDTRPDLMFWGLFHVATAAFLPFLVGRVLCSWMCPNATMQDALFKNMSHARPLSFLLPQSVEKQSCSTAMTLSGKIDKTAPYMPFTLLLLWFIVFNVETIWDLTQEPWWPAIAYMFLLMAVSFLMPWRKLCTHYCWLSGYRAFIGQNSLWRIRYNKSKCKQCKRCLAEEACPFFIDICNQDSEMPATCCLCFSCMEACPFEGVITFRRPEEEKERLRAASPA